MHSLSGVECQQEVLLCRSDAHLAQLERKHKALEVEIQRRENLSQGDEVKIAALKRRKLKIKDEITQLKKPPRTALALELAEVALEC